MDNQAFELLMAQLQDLKVELAELKKDMKDVLAWRFKLTGIVITLTLLLKGIELYISRATLG